MKWLPVVALAACVDSGPGPQGKKIDPQYIQQHLLPAVPSDIDRFDVPVGDSLIYLGNKVDKPRVAPGQAVTITHYWKVIRPIGDRWALFTHVRGPGGSADFMNLGASDMEIGHGPATWLTGEIIEDIQTFVLRPDWRSVEATVLVGLIELGQHGTLDRMSVEGPRTRDRAVIATKLEVDLAHAPPPKGTTYITRAQGAITIDGVANDPGWATIPATELVTAEGGTDPIGKATAKLTWDDSYLYAFVTVVDSDIVAPFKQHDEELWKGDCVELFIDADGNKQGYVELQVNPNNATFDKWYPTTRTGTADMSYDANMTTAVKLRGATEGGDSGDQGWDVEIAIPWDAVKGKAPDMKVRLPPQVGDRWRLNLVRVDRKTGAKENEVAASSWNRITMGDFHALDRMLVGVFADESGSIVPQAKPKDDGSAAQTGSGSGSASGSGAGSATRPGSGSGAGSAAQTGSGSATRPGSGSGAGSAAQTGSGSAGRPASGSGSGSAARPGSGSATIAPGSAVIAPRPGSGSAVIAPRQGSGSAVIAPRQGSGSGNPR